MNWNYKEIYYELMNLKALETEWMWTLHCSIDRKKNYLRYGYCFLFTYLTCLHFKTVRL